MLFTHVSPGMLRFAYRLCGDPDIAQEVVQDVWLTSLKSLRRLKDPRAFKSWIFRAVKWQSLDTLRKQQATEKLKKHFEEQASDEQAEQKRDELLTLISRLPFSELQVVYLFYQEDMKLNEIALIEEIPVGTVKSKLNRARLKLKEPLEKQDEFR